jgi:hypothetical protein
MTGRAVVVARAPDIVAAQIWVDALRDEGIEARLFEQSPGAALGGAITTGIAQFPLLVRETDFAAARAVIARLAGMEPLQPLPDEAAEDASRRWALFAVIGIAVGAMLLAFIVQLASR